MELFWGKLISDPPDLLLDSATKSWLMDLITRNMKALYEKSDWGWKTANFMLRVMRSISHDLVAESNSRPRGLLISFSPQKVPRIALIS